MKKTMFHYFCKAVGWQGGTIHQAKEYFNKTPLHEQNKICSMLVGNLNDISDVENVRYFTDRRLQVSADQLRLMAVCQADKL